MSHLERLKAQVSVPLPEGWKRMNHVYQYQGYRQHYGDPVPIARAYAQEALCRLHPIHLYEDDMVLGSLRSIGSADPAVTDGMLQQAESIVTSYGQQQFWMNYDHFAPDYATVLEQGVPGILEAIRASARKHSRIPKKAVFLEACRISMQGFSDMLDRYAHAAGEKAAASAGETGNRFRELSRICHSLTLSPPSTFHEALQLIWLIHLTFSLQGRYAMAFGRLDQLLYPFYVRDKERGILDDGRTRELLACTFYKIGERRLFAADDVVNIAVGGVKRDGSGAVNELSYLILQAVEECHIPGPNLSARLYADVPEEFVDACLRVIGTGIGYPALMNDEVNIPALVRYGYTLEDCRDYCMVGCIENFIQGKQPPWSDGRFHSPKYLEYALNGGVCMQTGLFLGTDTPPAEEIGDMGALLDAVEKQMAFGAAEYMAVFRNENARYNRDQYVQPFLSCFCRDCIGRGLDINDGGALYPSVHGVCGMGIATMADSLAAIEQVVFQQKKTTLAALREALKANFDGYEALRADLLAAPKYGNNLDFVDKYAVWFVECHARIFSRYKTRDGGGIYLAIASNVQNISAGLEVAATPDGRLNGTPLSDAASPMHGRDRDGPTTAFHSLAKPDYTLAGAGTVVNQKYSPAMFRDPQKRACLSALIRAYFQMGGQEVQINSISREMLRDAMMHPDEYRDLVVRVSGFSAYYISLDQAVQEDILMRTEHG